MQLIYPKIFKQHSWGNVEPVRLKIIQIFGLNILC